MLIGLSGHALTLQSRYLHNVLKLCSFYLQISHAVMCTHRIVEELIQHDRPCVKHRVLTPHEALKAKYD